MNTTKKYAIKDLTDQQKAFIENHYVDRGGGVGNKNLNTWISKELGIKHTVVVNYISLVRTKKHAPVDENEVYKFKAPILFCGLHGCALTGNTCIQCMLEGIK